MLHYLELAETARRVAHLLPPEERDRLLAAVFAAVQPDVTTPGYGEALMSIQNVESWTELKLRLTAVLSALSNEARAAGWASAMITLAADLDGADEKDRLQGRTPPPERARETERLRRLADIGPNPAHRRGPPASA